MANHFSILALRTHEQYEKAKQYDTERWTPQVGRYPIMRLEISGEITPERMKGWSQSKNNTQLWMWQVMAKCSDKTWSTGELNGKSLQYSCLENPMNSMKRQKDRTLKDELPGWLVTNVLLEIRGEITSERMKRWSQSKSNTQLWIWLVMEVKSDAIKSNIA